MAKIVVTGAGGFLGFHVRAAAQESGSEIVSLPLGKTFDAAQSHRALEGADRLIHLAGVNRGTDAEVADGNALFVHQLETVLDRVDQPPSNIVYANSIQAGNGSIYGTAKQTAGETLAAVAARVGSDYDNVLLPNLFGEYGRPFYNSVVATFCHLIAEGQRPEIHQDTTLQLLHAQNAAEVLLGTVPSQYLAELSQWETVTGIKDHLEEFAQYYSAGEFPDIATTFRRDLFNTYRSYTFPANAPVDITRHADHRGSFFEIVRSRGGTGQTSFSTTAPDITRGDHYHRRKVERFTVLAGDAEIRLRRLFDDKVFTYRISGDEPKSVDMPTFYAHNIRNVGTQTLYTAFWTNDIFDPDNPDTIAETV